MVRVERLLACCIALITLKPQNLITLTYNLIRYFKQNGLARTLQSLKTLQA